RSSAHRRRRRNPDNGDRSGLRYRSLWRGGTLPEMHGNRNGLRIRTAQILLHALNASVLVVIHLHRLLIRRARGAALGPCIRVSCPPGTVCVTRSSPAFCQVLPDGTVAGLSCAVK